MGPGKQKDNMKRLAILTGALFLFSCSSHPSSDFIWIEDNNGIKLHEKEEPVFYYRKTPNKVNDTIFCNNYIHPLYLPGGDLLTEEFPSDHPYHRGIFWAWHQLYEAEKSLGDSWIMSKISFQVTKVISRTDSLATLDMDVDWVSSVWQNNKPFLHEHTTIVVFPVRNGLRQMDFVITLQALTKDISLGGSDDEKGYGGFCIRMRIPDNMTFMSDSGSVIPQTLQVIAGPWMDFSGTFDHGGKPGGVTILCHPSNPVYPAPWILRKETSMQNSVFPGREPAELSENKPLVLRYRIILHQGILDIRRLSDLQAVYNQCAFPDTN